MIRRWIACGILLWSAAASRAGEPTVSAPDLARAVDAAIAGLSEGAPPAVVEESRRFLAAHGPASGERLLAAKGAAQGVQLLRILTVLEELEQQREEVKAQRSGLPRTFSAEPTLRFLLALAWGVLVIVAARVFRQHLSGPIHAYIESWKVHVDARTLAGIERLIAGIVILVGFNLGMVLFVIKGLPEESQGYYDAIRRQVFNGLFFVAVGYGLLKILDILFDSYQKRYEEEEGADGRLVPLLRNGVKGILVAGTMLLVLENVAGNVLSLHLAVAVAGVSLALACREGLSNLVSSLLLFLGRSYAVGDRVVAAGVDGYVERIGLQATRIRSLDGSLAVVPNAAAARGVITNLSRMPHAGRAFSVRLRTAAPAASIERAAAVLRESLQRNRQVVESWVHLAGLGPQGFEIEVRFWCRQTDPRRLLEETEGILLDVKRRFDAEKITEHLADGA